MHSALGAFFGGSYVRARLVLSSYVRTCVILTSYVRDRVRARLRSLVGVTLLGLLFDRKCGVCATFCSKLNFASILHELVFCSKEL